MTRWESTLLTYVKIVMARLIGGSFSVTIPCSLRDPEALYWVGVASVQRFHAAGTVPRG
jgi:hypothetical protein